MRAWRITWNGITGVYAARSRGRARYLVALVLDECWETPPAKAFREMTCRRAPELDEVAAKMEREGGIVQ